MDKHQCELDVIGIDAPLANALRRIMIAEVIIKYLYKVIISEMYRLLKLLIFILTLL
jgi:DNA-directed RNA polymerase alpha subunit